MALAEVEDVVGMVVVVVVDTEATTRIDTNLHAYMHDTTTLAYCEVYSRVILDYR